MSRKNLTYIGLALAGGAVGAIVGLLAAPYAGRETRRRIARTVRDQKDAIVRRGYQTVDEFTDYLRAS
ncbi:MAG TPA: YtxH domain-containing protein [Vicinamibacteria bacterium]|nr:YtxH domain-containing protein [Vicinamibacteria bacterium]